MYSTNNMVVSVESNSFTSPLDTGLEMSGTSKLSPFVFWAQTARGISLRIGLQGVKCPQLNITENKLEFSATGTGAKGQNEYCFGLEFWKDIKPEVSHYKVMDREVQIAIEKEHGEWWPRLIRDKNKPAWLKVDFDKLKTEDDDEDEEIENFYKSFGDSEEQYPDLKWRERKISRKKVEDFRKIYLFLYNLFQFVGFLYILIVLCIKYAKEGPDSMDRAYSVVGSAIKFCHLMQLLEVLHPMLGYTSGSAVMPFIQVTGRLIMIFGMVHSEPRMQTKPAVFYLFFIYSLVEVVRYPYYMLRVYNASISFLTWLRYTMWIPLYPLGFVCEGVVILRNIPFFEETHKFTISLPNPWNISFYFPTVMRLYLLLGLFPFLYFMMTHMHRQRMKILDQDKELKRD